MDRTIKDRLPDWARYVEAEKPLDDRIMLEPSVVYPLFFEKLGWQDAVADSQRVSRHFDELVVRAKADIAQMTAEPIEGKSVAQIKGILDQVAEKAERIQVEAIQEFKDYDKGSLTRARFECARRCFTEALFQISGPGLDIRISRDVRYKLVFFPEGQALNWQVEYKRINKPAV